MSEPAFIPATDGHRDEVIGLMRKFYAAEQIAFELQTAEMVFGELTHTDGHGRIYLITTPEKTAGYLIVTFCYSAEFRGRFLLLDELYLREEFRGKGFGRRALDFAAGVGRACGLQIMRLEVSRKNQKALALYLNAGFKSSDRDFLSKNIGDEKPFV